MSTLPLSNDDEEVIHRDLPPSAHKTDDDVIDYVYEIRETASKLNETSYTKVALQFPDELLVDATSVTDHLSQLCPGIAFYVLGDTSYGSCCVDEVAAEHVDAQVLIHYGRSCLSTTSRLPVIYVFGRHQCNVGSLIKAVKGVLEDGTKILLFCDTMYYSSQPRIASELNSEFHVREVLIESPNGVQCRSHGLSGEDLGSYTLLYIGPPSPTLTCTLLSYTSAVAKIYSFNPDTNSLNHETTQNAALRRRYAVVQKARDAGVIGIVVGTLGVNKYLDLIKHLKAMIATAHKKSYLLAMGKLNPAKLANFAEIDVFVLVACSENSMIDGKDFYRPLVTPFELSLALRARPHDAIPWTGEWITDFDKVMTLEDKESDEHEEYDADAPHFSLVTGKYSSTSQPMYTGLETAEDSDYALAIRNKDNAISLNNVFQSPAAQYLQRKGWSGLGSDDAELAIEDRDVKGAVLSQGRSGIARDYGAP